MAHRKQHSALFPDQFSKPVKVTFDQEAASSDGGALLLGAVDRGVGLTEALVSELHDPRDPWKTEHTFPELFRQRVYGIALGYPDGNDAARIATDPILKELCDRPALKGEALASQPTLSRFENTPSARELVGMGRTQESFVIQRHKKRRGKKVRRITIDLDPSDDPTYGQQPFTFFNAHYDNWCYLPQFGFLTFDDEPDQYLFHARLRPGNVPAARGALPLLRRTVAALRLAFPKATIRVRLDGGFANPLVFACLEGLKVEYVVAMAKNPRLLALAAPFMEEAKSRSAASGQAEQVFGEFSYKADSWPHERRTVVKAEVVHLEGREPRENPRFVITNLPFVPKNVYRFYRGRGEIENRIKELHYGLEIDRTSCSRFLPNQFRVLQAATAYILFQELRLRSQRTELARMQVWTIRERLFKIGARIVESARRIVLHLPSSYPWPELWQKVARAVGAVPT